MFRTQVDSFLLEDHLVVSENDAYEEEEEDDEEDNSRLDLDTSEEDDLDDDDEATSSSEDPGCNSIDNRGFRVGLKDRLRDKLWENFRGKYT